MRTNHAQARSFSPSHRVTLRLVALLAATLACAFFPGCGVLQPGADPVVVRAEQATAAALETFDAFLLIEHQNRGLFLALDPGIRQYADHLRVEAPRWLATARAATAAYKGNRSPERRATLNTGLAVLATGLAETQRYLVKTQTITP